jgi:hypothetical protein
MLAQVNMSGSGEGFLHGFPVFGRGILFENFIVPFKKLKTKYYDTG